MYYGFDIGGTKIALGVFDKQRRLQWETRVPTPRDSYDAFLDAVCNLVMEADQRFGIKGSVGIGILACRKRKTARCTRPTFLPPVANRSAQILALALTAMFVWITMRTVLLSPKPDDEFTQYPLVMGLILGTGVGGGTVLNGNPSPDAAISPASLVIFVCRSMR